MKTREQIEARLRELMKKVDEIRFELEYVRDPDVIETLNLMISGLLKQTKALYWVLND